MIKTSAVPRCVGLSITDDYKDWRPNQSWLTEKVRMVASRLYAQAEGRGGKRVDGSPLGIHIGTITSQTAKIFGALYDEDASTFSVAGIIDNLVQLGDLGNTGHGYYIPRESRVVRMTRDWGRIAGGLPLDLSEQPEGGIENLLEDTFGRIVRLRNDFRDQDQEAENSEIYESITSTDEKRLESLLANLPDRAASRPPGETTEFYNAGLRRGRGRGDRWQSKMSIAPFVVARSRTIPAHYYLVIARSGGSTKWFEIGSEGARPWILLAEKMGGVVNLIRLSGNDEEREFFLPDMLPQAWIAGVLACASTVTPWAEGGWRLKVQREAFNALEVLFHSANIQLI